MVHAIASINANPYAKVGVIIALVAYGLYLIAKIFIAKQRIKQLDQEARILDDMITKGTDKLKDSLLLLNQDYDNRKT